jgi:hypothetical protein
MGWCLPDSTANPPRLLLPWQKALLKLITRMLARVQYKILQISSSMQAGVGFMDDFVPTVMQAIANDEPQAVPGWQAGQFKEEVLGPGLSPTPPSSRIGSSLAWFSSSLAQCVSNCLRALLGACSSRLG